MSGVHSKATPEEKPRKRYRRFWEWGSVVLVALVLSIGIRGYALQAFYVPSGSMIPTLAIGDRIVVDKIFFSSGSVARGTIVVFRHPSTDNMCGSPGEDLVKRVIAVGGQTIWSEGNAIYITGKDRTAADRNKPITEKYLPKGTQLGSTPIRRQTIPNGEVFLLGDNRAISCDSRYWGPIPTTSIIGKVVTIFWRSGHPYLHFF